MVAVEANAVLSFLASSILTLGILFSLLFMGIFHGPLLPYVGGTLLTAVFNGVIAIPVYALLKKIVGSPSRLG
jgi:hypothetical protein